jgi:hypothetical protein
MSLTFLSPSAPANAATAAAGNLVVLRMGNDRFLNYDFLSEHEARNNVDWTMTVIFYDNATIDRSKSRVEDWGDDFDDNSSNSMHALLSNYYDDEWRWDGDRGKKTPACPGTLLRGRDYSPHYRVYSTENGDRESLYNTTWGYWNVASTHRDWYECGGNDYYERPEAIENHLIEEVDENTATRNDVWTFHNYEAFREEGNHLWTGNGLASEIKIR